MTIDILAHRLAIAKRERDELRDAKDREWTGSGLTDAYGRLLDRYYAAHRRVAVLTNELEEAKAREERAKTRDKEHAYG